MVAQPSHINLDTGPASHLVAHLGIALRGRSPWHRHSQAGTKSLQPADACGRCRKPPRAFRTGPELTHRRWRWRHRPQSTSHPSSYSENRSTPTPTRQRRSCGSTAPSAIGTFTRLRTLRTSSGTRRPTLASWSGLIDYSVPSRQAQSTRETYPVTSSGREGPIGGPSRVSFESSPCAQLC
jgi:hypothetical protein